MQSCACIVSTLVDTIYREHKLPHYLADISMVPKLLSCDICFHDQTAYTFFQLHMKRKLPKVLPSLKIILSAQNDHFITDKFDPCLSQVANYMPHSAQLGHKIWMEIVGFAQFIQQVLFIVQGTVRISGTH